MIQTRWALNAERYTGDSRSKNNLRFNAFDPVNNRSEAHRGFDTRAQPTLELVAHRSHPQLPPAAAKKRSRGGSAASQMHATHLYAMAQSSAYGMRPYGYNNPYGYTAMADYYSSYSSYGYAPAYSHRGYGYEYMQPSYYVPAPVSPEDLATFGGPTPFNFVTPAAQPGDEPPTPEPPTPEYTSEGEQSRNVRARQE